MTAEGFPPDFATSHRRFANAARRLRWQLFDSPPVDGPPAVDPTGSLAEPERPLCASAAVSSFKPTDTTLFVSCGVHGVEAFMGSAILAALCRDLQTSGMPAGLRIVLLHAVCPFGFQYVRRVDEANRDLNRNFLLPGEQYRGAPDLYRELDPLLNPRRPLRGWEPFTFQALLPVLRHGLQKVQAAISSGQYEFPQGLFFGGGAPSPMQSWLVQHLPAWLGQSHRVIHLDLHSGLGRWAGLQFFVESPLDAHARTVLQSCQPSRIIESTSLETDLYRATGSFARWCAAHSTAAQYAAVVAEFGTYSPLKILRALRAENTVHHVQHPPTTARWAKQQLKEAFCPRSPAWREAVLHRSRNMFQTVLNLQAADFNPST